MTFVSSFPHIDLSARPWVRTAQGARLLKVDGTAAPTIFEEMTAAANRTGALNLGQGFPDTDGPQDMIRYAAETMLQPPKPGAASPHQYAPGSGSAVLRSAVSEHQNRFYGLDLDPDTQVVATTGATEAIAATLLAFCTPGSNVVVLEPFYDSYGAIASLAGAELHPVPLLAPDFQPDPEALRAAVDGNTAVIIVNDPHNPTGTRFTQATRQLIVDLARRHDAVILADEVYEHLVFGGGHSPIATLPGAAERTVTASSAGKTFSLTGWKVGWATGPADLITAIRTVKQFLTYSSGPAYQPAVARGLGYPDEFFSSRAADLGRRAQLLAEGLEATGAHVFHPQGGYFVVADLAPLGISNATAAARLLPDAVGVVGIPVGVFCVPEHEGTYSSLLRFAHCKRDDVISAAAERLAQGLPRIAEALANASAAGASEGNSAGGAA
ncbi:MAG: aminotransferase class I/II-fold pyridoxal phosphate-dependent enzyme [Galactobacter sp.]